MRYNTGNPVGEDGSSDPRDLYDNAGIIDLLMTGPLAEYLNRLGVPLRSWRGIMQQVTDFLIAQGYESIYLTYGAGVVVERQTQLVQRDGELYRVMNASDIPLTLTGTWSIDAPKLQAVGDIALRQALAAPGGSDLVFHGPGTVGDALDEQVADIAALVDLTQPLTGSKAPGFVTKEGRALEIGKMYRRPQRMRNKTLPTTFYDHFGFMDLLPSGKLMMLWPRKTNHLSSAPTMFTSLDDNGQWATPVSIGTDAEYIQGGGGVLPDGRIISVGCQYIAGVYQDIQIYRSDDYGSSFSKIQTIPKGAFDYRVFYGKIKQLGSKLVITWYGKSGTTFTLGTLQSVDGGDTWSFGPNISVGPNDYNEAEIVDCGGGVWICVSRTGSGTVGSPGGGRLRQFITGDGGLNWSNQGDVTGADINGSTDEITENNWQLVAPSLEYVVSPGGTPHVALIYSARTSGVRIRTCSVLKLTAGSTKWSNWATLFSLAGTFESGYQSVVKLDENRMVGNVYRVTTTDAVSVPSQFDIVLGDLPDFESDWIPIGLSQTLAAINHGLQGIPSKYRVDFSTDQVGSLIYELPCALAWQPSGSANQGVGALVTVNSSGFIIRTGASSIIPGAFFGSPAHSTLTSGYVRVRADR